MSFTDKTAIAYKAIITSFDDDYYYGTFFREYEDGCKEYLSAFYICLDSENSSLYFDGTDKLDEHTLTDFVADDTDRLEDEMFKIIYQSAHAIHSALKIEGKMIELEIA